MAQSQVKTKQTAGGIETMPELKSVAEVRAAPGGHWVGDGFPSAPSSATTMPRR